MSGVRVKKRSIMSHHIGLQVLRAKIRGLQAAGSTIHHRIRKAKGAKRNRLWDEKRRLGCYNREHLIAYGLLRGIAYERIEHCAEENRPSAARVLELMKAHGDWAAGRELTLEKVEAMLVRKKSEPPSPAPPPPPPIAEVVRQDQLGLLARARRLLEKGLGS